MLFQRPCDIRSRQYGSKRISSRSTSLLDQPVTRNLPALRQSSTSRSRGTYLLSVNHRPAGHEELTCSPPILDQPVTRNSAAHRLMPVPYTSSKRVHIHLHAPPHVSSICARSQKSVAFVIANFYVYSSHSNNLSPQKRSAIT